APVAADWRWEGSVRDAYTGRALEGVDVELWNENMDAPAKLLCTTRTRADGTYALPDAERHGEKILVHKAGYGRTLDAASNDESVLCPAPEPAEVRGLALEGKPIAGALVLLRQTCRHAQPTVQAQSDAAGRVELRELPALRDNGDFEVLVPGYGAL